MKGLFSVSCDIQITPNGFSGTQVNTLNEERCAMRNPDDQEKLDRALHVASCVLAGKDVEEKELVGAVANLVRLAKGEGDFALLRQMLTAGAAYHALQAKSSAPKADDDLDDLDDFEEPPSNADNSNNTSAGAKADDSTTRGPRGSRRASRPAGPPGAGSNTDNNEEPSEGEQSNDGQSDKPEGDAQGDDARTRRTSSRRRG